MRTLSATTGDIDFKVVDELLALAQRCQQRLLFNLGEWLLDTSRGTPQFDVLGRFPEFNLIERIISDTLLTVDDVTDVTDIRLELDTNRLLTAELNVHSRFGMFSMEI